MIDPPTRLVLLGHPVSHSISPRFQNVALRTAGIGLTYETLDVAPEDLSRTMTALAAEHAAGNVTIPHKEAIAALCARRTPLAARVGAVNVFWHEHGELVGDNSDVGGAAMVMRSFFGLLRSNASVALIGAGGSAAAIICAAEECGVEQVRVFNRHPDRAAHLVARFPAIAVGAPTMQDALDDAVLVVNATPVGLRDDTFPVPVEMLPRGCGVFDLCYSATETAWVRASRDAGHHAADGEGMLLEQGAIAFERWFGRAPDRAAMWKALH